VNSERDFSGRDFSGRDLQRKSFAGADLQHSDFGGADVRGADFSGAQLQDASFVGARLGVPTATGWLILLASLVLSVVTGIAIGLLADEIMSRSGSDDWRDTFAAATLGLVVLAFLVVFITRGAATAVRWYLIAFVAVLAIDLLVVFLIADELRLRRTLPLMARFLLFGSAMLAGVIGRIVGGTFEAWAWALVAMTGGLAAGRFRGGIAAVIVMVILVYVSKRALRMDERDRSLRELAQRIVGRFGTSFNGTDLSPADFRETAPSQSDLRGAVTAGTIWGPGAGPGAEPTSDADQA
jgi:hypothetical protein